MTETIAETKLVPNFPEAAKFLNITEEALVAIVNSMGLTPADLNDDYVFRFSDFKDALSDKPIGAVRKAYRALRNAVEAKGDSIDPRAVELKQAFGVKASLSTADIIQLLRYYDPRKPSDPVTVELKRRLGEKRVIAFKIDSQEVDVETTATFVTDLEMGHVEKDQETTFNSEKRIVKLYPVGVLVDTIVDEDPLFPGKALRHDRSVVNHIDWSTVPHHKRILCRLVVELGLIDPDNRQQAISLANLAQASPDTALTDTYPEVDLEYRERQKRQTLPTLRMELGASKPNNPFGVNRKF